MKFTKSQLIWSAVIAGAITLMITMGTGEKTSDVEAPTSTNEATSTKTAPGSQQQQQNPIPSPLTGRKAPDLFFPTGFSNSDTLGLVNTNQFTLKEFIGKKIILLEFWTTSSLNSLHTIPYLQLWQNKYKDQGLLIVAVHTPRFEFERSKDIVDKTARDYGATFPIVLDTQYGTWNAYKNTVWPHMYLIDLNGEIVYDHAGEGAYAATHAKIESLLKDRARKLGGTFTPSPYAIPKNASTYNYTGIEAYFGAARNSTLANGKPLTMGQQTFEAVTNPKSNVPYLTGTWKFTKEYAENMTPASSVIFRHSTRNVSAVLGALRMIRTKILIDGKPLDTTNAGKDIVFEKGESFVYVSEERIYELISNPLLAGEHTIELIPDAGGLDVFTLTLN